MQMMKVPSGPGRSAQEAATIYHGDPSCLGIDDKPFGHAIAWEGDHVTRIEREHLLVALEPGAGTKPTIERIGQLLDLAALGPARGEAIGTLLVARTAKLAARKQWMADHLQLRGAVVVDDGAVAKLRDEGKSLLPIGVLEVQGEFVRGDVIAVRSQVGIEIARGLANYASSEARLIARKPSSQIESLLGYSNEPEMIHRTNLVLA